MKRLLLVFSLLLSNLVFGQTATAPENIGEALAGTSSNPYKIATVENLYWLSVNSIYWNRYFIQTADIDLAAASPAINKWNGNTGWSPIGNRTKVFTGSYDGNRKKINGLFINRDADYQGLFGIKAGKIIQNVELTNVSITGKGKVGGLVGYDSSSTISNSYVSGVVNGSDDHVGGLVGRGFYHLTISNSYKSGSVNGDRFTGGLVGLDNGSSTISNSYNSGSVNGSYWVGGLVGMIEISTINSSYNSGSVNGSGSWIGGLVGYDNYSSTISNCFWDKTINPARDNGLGIGKTTVEMNSYSTYINAGWDFIDETANGANDYWVIDENGVGNNGFPFLKWQRLTPVIFTKSLSDVSAVSVTGNGDITFLGYPANITQHGICWSTSENPTISDNKTLLGAVSSVGAFNSSITDILTNTIFYVRAYATDDYGTCYGEQVSFTYTGFDGAGTDTSPFLIKSFNDLKYLADHSELWSMSFRQTSNINASATNTWSGGGWIPIGNSTIKFSGKYDGQAHTINGLYISRTDAEYQGMFGYTLGSTIKNIGLTDVSINGNNFTGGLVGWNESSPISNSGSSGNVTGTYDIGGLIGYNTNSSISNSFSAGSVSSSGSFVGGLAGYNYSNSPISNSYSSVSINGNSSFTGGLLGYNGISLISDSYSSGNVNGSTRVGGLVGTNYSSTIRYCYSSGAVNAAGSDVGGLVGYNNSSYEVTGSFWNTTVNPLLTGWVGTGITSDIMKTQSTYLSAHWNPSIWNIGDGINNGYPYLKWQNPDGTPLPVELITFSAKVNEGKVILNWSTATELNNYGFEIERASLGTTPGQDGWRKIGFVQGAGNSNSPKQYSFTDVNPPAGNIQYRLKQIDTDGGYKYYSQIAEVNYNLTDVTEKQLPAEFALNQNYPNPFNPATAIKFSLPQSCNVTLDVYSILGKKIITLINKNMNAGYHEANFNGENLNSGVYIYRLTAYTPETGKQYTMSAKMVLIK